MNSEPATPVKYAPNVAFHGLPHEIRSKFHQGVTLQPATRTPLPSTLCPMLFDFTNSFNTFEEKMKQTMKKLKYVVYKEGRYYVSQCLNVDVSSFGNTIQEAIDNLNEALALYFDEPGSEAELPVINETLLGEISLNV
jgi:predicted RNase H-like HicB family nuclease